MNALATFAPTPATTGQPQTMSSREIAELTGKEHKHVLRDIREMLTQLDETSAHFWTHLPDAYGRGQLVAVLPKDLTITLVSGYSVPMRHRIVTRWMELETQTATAPAIPKTFTDALRLALRQQEQIEAQQKAIDAMAPVARVGAMVCEDNDSLHLFMRALRGAPVHQTAPRRAAGPPRTVPLGACKKTVWSPARPTLTTSAERAKIITPHIREGTPILAACLPP